jgi:hypothetical protein
MSFKYEVYKTQRVALVTFKRYIKGAPEFYFPDVDNRGCFRSNTNGTGFDRGPVVGVTEGDDIYVELKRKRIDKDAPLFVTSSDKTRMLVNGGTEKLANSVSTALVITGVSGSSFAKPNGAKVEIRYGSNTGVIIGELSVWVFNKLNVNLIPHRITIQDAAGTSVAPQADIRAITGLVNAIWQPCGINFTVAPVQNETLTRPTAGQLDWKAGFNDLLSRFWVAGSINAYFVRQLNRPNPGVLGVGLSRARVTVDASDPNPLPNPGIFLGDRSQNGIVRHTDVHWLANDLAHEIGHFFQIEHIDKRNSNNPRDDTWARRILMHPINTRNKNNNWRDDVGYGKTYRGSLITMKDLTDTNNATTNHITDPEYFTARTTINSSAGPY